MAIIASDGSFATTASIAIGALTLLLALNYLSGSKVHPKEPKVVRPWIPVIGHLVGMALQGGRYVKRLGLLHHADPIFTLPVPGSRLYIVTEPTLAATIQRTSKTLSFTPLVPKITKRVLGLDDQTVSLVGQNLDPEPGEPRGYLADIHDMVYGSLGPGAYLNELSIDAVRELARELSTDTSSPGAQQQACQGIDLLKWVRRFVTFGTAEYLFGPHNPLHRHRELEEDFWAFDHGLSGLLVGIFPSVTAAKAYRGREKVVAALKDYYREGHHKQASKIVRDRYRIEKDWNMSEDMTARSALSFLFAGIVNTTTTTFWVVLRLFADAKLLATVRAEIEESLQKTRELHGTDHFSIAHIKDGCPTLMAIYRECLRIGSENSSVRLVKEDMILNDRYYLMKGGVVQIAGGAMHADKTIWGDDVADFNPQRFLSGPRGNGSSFHPAAFRSFGGGKTLCPGRHFATNEIVCFAALIARYFDVRATDGRQVEVPTKNDMVMPVHILEPKPEDCPKVHITARPEVGELSQLQVVM